VRGALASAGVVGASIQTFGEEGSNEVIIRTPGESETVVNEALAQFVGENNFKIERIERVGPTVGHDLRMKALKAIGWAMVAILMYIGWRFRSMTFGMAAVVALVHDVVITVGMLALSGREISLAIIAALMTIVGYSLNDTIVVFDRIREDKKLMKKKPLAEIVNLSINQTLSRTILTSLTTLIVVVCLWFFGGEVINDFAFTLLVGIVVGTYSSIYVASPLIISFGQKK
jgi:preprotein translocase SecF subunit